MSPGELRDIRGGVVSYVFQEPGASLNPVFRVGAQIKESLKLHQPDKATDAEVIRLLKLVGIPAPESRIKDYPFQMSGGMQQRVMIAMALASEPKLLVADEPTTALDVTIQAQILELLRDLKQRLGMAILLITHNLGIVGDMADRVAVMYAGQIVELAPARELLRRPLHPYTRALMASVPKLARRSATAHQRFPATCRGSAISRPAAASPRAVRWQSRNVPRQSPNWSKSSRSAGCDVLFGNSSSFFEKSHKALPCPPTETTLPA